MLSGKTISCSIIFYAFAPESLQWYINTILDKKKKQKESGEIGVGCSHLVLNSHGHMCAMYRIMNERGDLFCRFVRFLIILSSCQTLCTIYLEQALCRLTCNDALKETDNKRALCASFPAWYYRAQWSITCRDMAVHSGLTHGHNMKEVPPCSTPKLISPDYILDFLKRHRRSDVIV